MKKILIGCVLVISTVSYSAIEAVSTFEQLELTFQQLEAEEAEKVLVSLRAKYQKILETEKYIIEVEQYRYYQEDYKELLKKCRTMKGELEAEIAAKEEIIDIYRAIM